MGRKRTPGLRLRSGIWHIDKQVCGIAICQSTGTSKLEEAELILAKRVDETRLAVMLGVRKKRTFREAATKYLEENIHLGSIADIATHLKQLDPFIGHLPLENVHIETLQAFIRARRKDGKKTKTINNALGIVRNILNLSARLWRDADTGLTWLVTPPLIEMLPVNDARKPYPLSWQEQRLLLQACPDHIAAMLLYKVNTGCREQEVCGLRWDWEVKVPELNTSVFVIPGDKVKNGEDRVVVLNRVAKSIIEQRRGQHDTYVFTYKGERIGKINNTAFKNARRKAGLDQICVHSFKHTFGRRLRAAGVSAETRKVLLGHKNGDITTHYSAAELDELLTAANKVCENESGKTPTLTLLTKRVGAR